jgi:hypothetical protein
MHEELLHAMAQNESLGRELRAVRQGSASSISPEQASQVYSLKQIVLGRGTGGYDDDDCPGDEALRIVLEPRDSDGHTIKAPGTLHVDALETSPEGIKTPLCSWDLSPDQLRRTWHSGLLSTGYSVVLPWKRWPSSERIRVIARFTLMDGRVFEADKDVTIRLTPEIRRKPLPGAEPGNAAPERSGPEPLPTPRKAESRTKPPLQQWWQPHPVDPSVVQPAVLSPSQATPSLADAVQLLRPIAVTDPPEPNFGP